MHDTHVRTGSSPPALALASSSELQAPRRGGAATHAIPTRRVTRNIQHATANGHSDTSPHLPLEHLRRGPGRPRKARNGDIPSYNRRVHSQQQRDITAVTEHGAQALRTSARLLDRQRAALYLGVSLDTLDRLTAQGRLRRLVIPGTRLIRFDVQILDSFINSAQ